MFLNSLSLQNFRSFSKKELTFNSKATLIIGPNAIGKTNILEAIYLLSTGKSFRAGREEEMIKDGEEMARIEAFMIDGALVGYQNFDLASRIKLAKKLDTDNIDSSRSHCGSSQNLTASPHHQLEIILTKGEVGGKGTARKIYKVNGVGKRWKDFTGNLRCVLFRPEDIDLILGTPKMRRNYLDSVLEQIDWQYRACNLTYQKGLRQRNKLLERIREGQAQKSQLNFWDQLLLKNGAVVSQKRQEFIDFINQYFREDQEEHGSLEVIYDKSIISQERLEKYYEAGICLGATLVGPHRDDIAISKIKNQKSKIRKNLALYGSRGEQRMAVLNLKRAELAYMTEKTGQKPVLLLDDIFSELDQKNRNMVFKIIDQGQVIISALDQEERLVKPSLREMKVINIDNL